MFKSIASKPKSVYACVTVCVCVSFDNGHVSVAQQGLLQPICWPIEGKQVLKVWLKKVGSVRVRRREDPFHWYKSGSSDLYRFFLSIWLAEVHSMRAGRRLTLWDLNF